MFSARLKEATKPAHQSLEKIIIQQIRAIQTPAEYKRLLLLFYSYFHPLERVLGTFFDNTNIIPQFDERRKSAAILQDMDQIQTGSPIQTDDCADIPPVHSVAEALGVQYVLEGSTLGGAFIAKMLYQQACIPETQLHFFKSYGERSATMWQLFTDALNTYVQEQGKEHEIIERAIDCFEKFERWAKTFYAEAPGPVPPSVLA